jgi:hypothetical protein
MLTRKDLCIATALFVLPHTGCFGRGNGGDAVSSTDAAATDAVGEQTTGDEADGDGDGDGDTPSSWGSPPPVHAATTPSAPVGTLPGAAGVDPTGSATYRIPIEVPAGAAGMQPELALTYRSGGPDGLLGVGWTLEGLGRVERCEKTIADDGAASGVEFAANDALCWDGMRLIPVAGSSGADGTEYRTRIDRHARIVGHGSIGQEDSWFEAFTRDGRILKFGRGPDARIRRDGIPMVWTLDEISDRLGHTISYTYTSEQFQWLAGGIDRIADVAHRPVRIDYTHFGNAAPERSVRFRYRNVLPRNGWSRGLPTRRAHLIEAIETFGPDGLVRRHDLRHENEGTSGRWRLVGARVCDTHGACLPETTFKWDLGEVGVSDVGGSYDGQSYESSLPDQDVVFRVMLDANGDGATDMAVLSDPPPAGEWRVWLGRGRGDAYPNFTEIETGIEPWAAFPNMFHAYPGMAFRAQAIDFNDDRHGDIIYVAGPDIEAPGGHYGGSMLDLLVAYGDTPASFGFERREIDDGSLDTIFHALFPDLDGDGRQDVLLCRGEHAYDSRWIYALNRPTGIGGTLADGYVFDFTGGGVDTGVSCSVHDDYLEVDRDGDGDDDVLLVPAYEGGEQLPEDERLAYQALAIDTGAGSAELVDAGLPRDLLQRWRACAFLGNGIPESFLGAGPGQDKLGDFNGDGLVDLMRFELAVGDGLDQLGDILEWFTDGEGCPPSWGTPESAGIRVYWNTGAGFVRGDWARLHDERGDLTHFRISSVFDYDSDGRADLLLPDPTPPYDEVDSWSVLRARDLGFELVSTGIPGVQLGEYTPNTRLQPIGDHDGNGIHDLAVEYNLHMVDLWRNEARFPDLLVEVRDGFGAINTFDYGLTRDPETHEVTTGCTGSAHDVCANAIRPIVTSMSVDNGLLPEDHRVLEYHYTGGASSREGRGFLGFERVRVVERVADEAIRVVETEYDDGYEDTVRDHPFARIPWRTFVAERTNVEFESEQYRFTETIQAHDVRPSALSPGIYDIVPTSRQVRIWDTDAPCEEMVDLVPVCEDGELLQLWTSFFETTWEHDDFGNVLSARTRTEDEDDYDETERTYLNDVTSWIIGRPLTQVDRSHTASGALGERTVEFGYDPETGLLDWVVRALCANVV